ncbi:MAG: hypothetical protein D3925_02155 [Candidatus Electrothrix sp. AR5]|nr:hypothetical protein [Candidatus Electrothrix sp. AR5]
MRTPKDYGVAFLLQLVMAKKINPIMIFINSFCRQYSWSVSIVNLFLLPGDAMVGAGLCFCSIYPGKHTGLFLPLRHFFLQVVEVGLENIKIRMTVVCWIKNF